MINAAKAVTNGINSTRSKPCGEVNGSQLCGLDERGIQSTRMEATSGSKAWLLFLVLNGISLPVLLGCSEEPPHGPIDAAAQSGVYAAMKSDAHTHTRPLPLRPDASPQDIQFSEPGPAASAPERPARLNLWTERANWRYFNRTLELPWERKGGDWIDSSGTPFGDIPYSTVNIVDDNLPGPVELDVLPVIEDTGKADFFIRRRGGTNYKFHSRETGSTGPTLILNGGLEISAEADTDLSTSTVKALGDRNTLNSSGPTLIRFVLPDDLSIKQAILRLESTGKEYGDQTLMLFAPMPRVKTIQRPAWVSVDPTIIIQFNGKDVASDRYPITVDDDIATSRLFSPKSTWVNAQMIIPSQTQACATIYQRLRLDFRPGLGGKLPGFSNTGGAHPGSDVIDGKAYPDTGWGGRKPDGVHWSARTGYGRWTDTHVGSHTYFYAMSPHNGYGWGDPIGYPYQKGKWTAYVQCLKLNTVTGGIANEDGALYYEMPGVGPLYSREDIRFRDFDVPESMIREFWVNYYCGGRGCGDINNRGTIDFASAVITRGLPDMNKVEAEVARLDREHP